MTPEEIRQTTEAIAGAHAKMAVQTAENMLGELSPIEEHSLMQSAVDGFSKWLAAVREEAHDEGWRAGYSDHETGDRTTNPYRRS